MRIRIGNYRYSPGWILFVGACLGAGAAIGALRAAYELGVAQR